MGLFDPENDAEARVLATALIAAMVAGAIPQEDWTHTTNADGSPTSRGLDVASRVSARAYVLADVIIMEAERRMDSTATASSPDEELDRQAALADPSDPLEMGETELRAAAAADVPDIGDLLDGDMM